MKSLLGQANKGIGKLKGFIWGSFSSSEESQSTSTSQENQIRENPSSASNSSKPNLGQKIPTSEKSQKKEETKSSAIIKSSKGQFDFSEEDDEEDSKPKKSQNEPEITDDIKERKDVMDEIQSGIKDLNLMNENDEDINKELEELEQGINENKKEDEFPMANNEDIVEEKIVIEQVVNDTEKK